MLLLNTRLLIALLWLTGRSRRFSSAERLLQGVARDRKNAKHVPPASVQRSMQVSYKQVAGMLCYRLASPQSRDGSTQVLYLHGGAHSHQMTQQHWHFLADLARRSGVVFHVPIFPLAPEANHRQVMEAVDRVWVALRQAPGRQAWALMGDSSGAGLALSLTQTWRSRALPMPDSMLLMSPWVDLTLEHAQKAYWVVRDPWLGLPGMALAAQWWAGDGDVRSAPVSPLHGSQEGLPATLLFVGTRELLIEECRVLGRKAAAQGWRLEMEEGRGMIHVWPLLPLREAAAARARMAAWLQQI